MSKQIFSVSSVALASSLLLASCSPKAPSQTTTINVEVPDAKAGDDKVASSPPTVEIDETEEGQAAKAQGAKTQTRVAQSSEPTDRDVEDPVPASKTNSPAQTAGSSRNKTQLLDFYDRLPAKHFASFGGVNRRSLLNRKGAIVDYKHRFIEIPGSANPYDGDLHKLQITLFPNGDEPWCAVSRIVWPGGDTPGAVDFYYGESDSPDRHPRTAAAGFFPYKLQKDDGLYESAWLPQRGLGIRVSSKSDGDITGPYLEYNRKFRAGEPAFEEMAAPEST